MTVKHEKTFIHFLASAVFPIVSETCKMLTVFHFVAFAEEV